MKTLIAAMLLATAVPAAADSYDELNAGIQLHNQEDWSGAIQRLDTALASGDLAPSQQFIAYFDRGFAHQALKQGAEAIGDFTSALAVRPGDPAALAARAGIYRLQKQTELALADADSLIAARPMMSAGYHMRATINLQRGDKAKAVADIRTILSQRPEDTPLNREDGVLYWAVGQLPEAEKNFRRAAEEGNGNIYAWLWLTLVDLRQGEPVPLHEVPTHDEKFWPAPLVTFFLGESDSATVMAAAGQGDKNAVPGQVCEANFYLGEWNILHQDLAGARPLIAKAAADCPESFIETMPARLEQAGLQ